MAIHFLLLLLCLERGSGVRVRLWKLDLLSKKLCWEEGGVGRLGVGVLPASGGGILLLFLGEGSLQLRGSLTN